MLILSLSSAIDRSMTLDGVTTASRDFCRRSKHPVVVQSGFRYGLDNIPVLHDLSVFEPEDLNDRRTGVPGFTNAVHMGDDEAAVREDPLDLDAERGMVRPEPGYAIFEAFDAVGDYRIVLHEVRADVLGGSPKVLFVVCGIVEGDDIRLVRFQP